MRPSRADDYRAAGLPVPFMQVGAGAYLWDALFEAGPIKRTGMGDTMPLEWVDLVAYSEGSGTVSPGEELRILRAMSRAFLDGLRAGENPLSKDPRDWDDPAW